MTGVQTCALPIYIARPQGRGELGFDVSFEAPPVDRAGDHPGRGQSIMAQPGDECLCIPMPERRMIDQPLADRRPAGGFHQLGVQRCLIDENQAFQRPTHERLAPVHPDPARLRHIRATLLRGEQSFFYG